jgi:hypothetical protein
LSFTKKTGSGITLKIFPSDQRDQQISSRYDFDQLFPVGSPQNVKLAIVALAALQKDFAKIWSPNP